MPHQAKIATCCYCGTRAALVLRGQVRHELACANCGAPLHELKMLKLAATGDRELVHPSPIRNDRKKHKEIRGGKKRRRHLTMRQKFLRQAMSLADDIFDDVFEDIFDAFD